MNKKIEANWLSDFVARHKVFSYMLLVGTLSILLFLGYIFYKDMSSEKTKNIAAAYELTALAMKENAESLATLPAIVKGFSTIIEGTVEAKFIKKEKEFNDKIERKLTLFETKIIESSNQLLTIKEQSKKEYQDISKKIQKVETIKNEVIAMKEELNALIPELKKYQNIQNPETLILKLSEKSNWEDGLPIVMQIQSILQKTKHDLLAFPAKYVEAAGDWCRKKNQISLARTFYEESSRRDPDRLSVQVELHTLNVEYDKSKRKGSLEKLFRLAVSSSIEIGQIKRIFNALIEIDYYEELKKLNEDLIKSSRYKDNKKALATFYRNLSNAKIKIDGYLSDTAFKDIETAYSLNPEDENVLFMYVRRLEDRKEYDKALINSKKLLLLDPADPKYYRLIGRLYMQLEQYSEAIAMLKKSETLGDYSDILSNRKLQKKLKYSIEVKDILKGETSVDGKN